MSDKPEAELNFEPLRFKYESDVRWELRREFIITYKKQFSMDKLLSLAQAFVNIMYSGHIYPPETVEVINRLSPEVFKNYFQKQVVKKQNAFPSTYTRTQGESGKQEKPPNVEVLKWFANSNKKKSSEDTSEKEEKQNSVDKPSQVDKNILHQNSSKDSSRSSSITPKAGEKQKSSKDSFRSSSITLKVEEKQNSGDKLAQANKNTLHQKSSKNNPTMSSITIKTEDEHNSKELLQGHENILNYKLWNDSFRSSSINFKIEDKQNSGDMLSQANKNALHQKSSKNNPTMSSVTIKTEDEHKSEELLQGHENIYPEVTDFVIFQYPNDGAYTIITRNAKRYKIKLQWKREKVKEKTFVHSINFNNQKMAQGVGQTRKHARNNASSILLNEMKKHFYTVLVISNEASTDLYDQESDDDEPEENNGTNFKFMKVEEAPTVSSDLEWYNDLKLEPLDDSEMLATGGDSELRETVTSDDIDLRLVKTEEMMVISDEVDLNKNVKSEPLDDSEMLATGGDSESRETVTSNNLKQKKTEKMMIISDEVDLKKNIKSEPLEDCEMNLEIVNSDNVDLRFVNTKEIITISDDESLNEGLQSGPSIKREIDSELISRKEPLKICDNMGLTKELHTVYNNRIFLKSEATSSASWNINNDQSWSVDNDVFKEDSVVDLMLLTDRPEDQIQVDFNARSKRSKRRKEERKEEKVTEWVKNNLKKRCLDKNECLYEYPASEEVEMFDNHEQKLKQIFVVQQDDTSYCTENPSPSSSDKKVECIPLSDENVGFKTLKLMGWSGGGLGNSAQGTKEPVNVAQQYRRSGFGSECVPRIGHFSTVKTAETSNDKIESNIILLSYKSTNVEEQLASKGTGAEFYYDYQDVHKNRRKNNNKGYPQVKNWEQKKPVAKNLPLTTSRTTSKLVTYVVDKYNLKSNILNMIGLSKEKSVEETRVSMESVSIDDKPQYVKREDLGLTPGARLHQVRMKSLEFLQNYSLGHKKGDLIFSADIFGNLERLAIHRNCSQIGLVVQILEDKNTLKVSKSTKPKELVLKLLKLGGVTENYQLVKPTM